MFVVFDIETTGFYESSCDVIEFAYALFDDNNAFVKSECLYFYYEGMSWSEEAYSVHQIPLSFLKEHKDKFRENLIKMYTVLRNANVIGHNAKSFDCPFCKTWLRRMGLEDLNYNIINDTMLAFKPITKKARIKLSKLAELRNVSDDNVCMMMDYWFGNSGGRRQHDAAYDVTLTALLTLDGIRNNLITFKPNVTIAKDEPAPNVIETSKAVEHTVTKALNPTRVLLKLRTASNEDKFVWVNYDREQYADIATSDYSEKELKELMSIGQYLDVTLVEQAEGYYTGTFDNITVNYHTTSLGDFINLKMPYGTFSHNDIDLNLILKNLYKEV